MILLCLTLSNIRYVSRILWVSFSRTDSGLCIYRFFISMAHFSMPNVFYVPSVFSVLLFQSFWLYFPQVTNVSRNYYYSFDRLIGLVGRVFINGPGDLGSIPGHVIPKTLKMVLDTALLNTQQYKVYIKGKVEQSRERSSALPYTSV